MADTGEGKLAYAKTAAVKLIISNCPDCNPLYSVTCVLKNYLMYTIYGIPNCDVIKKVINWFNDQKTSYVLHDYKKEGISSAALKNWCKQVGWETIFNKRSTTWKELGETAQASVINEDSAIPVMMEHTSIIKRPVIEKNGKVIVVGFDAAKYEELIR